MQHKARSGASLEELIEQEDLGLEILHPGGTQLTAELAQLCKIHSGSQVLDVACGTGESACYLAKEYGARVIGIDTSAYMVTRAQTKARQRDLRLDFREADAQNLPFADNTFDAVISECTICLLDKARAIREMIRVAKRGGYVGFHDICWKRDTPSAIQLRLAEIEGERPETLEGWQALCERAGLIEVQGLDRSSVIPGWIKESMRSLRPSAIPRIVWRILSKSGIGGLMDAWESERIFQSKYTGYALLVGRKPGNE